MRTITRQQLLLPLLAARALASTLQTYRARIVCIADLNEVMGFDR